ncbi:putative lipoprotein YiaD [Candidatus Phycosocius bacilliformis]|uniref:Putative lipoprotein YiaD n=1 Tax=Candidatus Phycosocius bacilliformis TaxID=1445552 RepID=A0A2P2ECB1_9PROT|nr:phosphate ABC transporter substrate-binding/OmpA family protein [Candidatus Phycosocius bacilliformis]GBF58699.1 putative lipoprotein YiaD [Candidatus Phycosocius bacilliformis]
MAGGRDEVPYDWDKVINPEPPVRARKPKPQPVTRSKRAAAGFRLPKLGVLEWMMAVTSAVIVVGLLVLFYMSWVFQVEGRGVAAQDEGQIPVVEGFAPGQPKPADVLFRIGGSASMGPGLMSDLVSAWMRARGFGAIKISSQDKVIEISGSRGGKTSRILIGMGSSHGGFEALTQQRVEAVMSSRQVLASEADRLSALGNLTKAASEKVIGLDASLVIVNRNNPLNRIDTETLSRILTGEISDWKQVSKDASGRINIKLEDLGADHDAGPTGRLLGDREAPDTAAFFTDSLWVSDAVSRDENAIGITRRVGNGVKTLMLNERGARSVGADDFSIATETYPFTHRLYLYVGTSGVDPNVRDFADFAASPQGQEVVARLGLTPLRLNAVRVLSPPDAPSDYRRFSRFAERMNFDIRFYEGTNEPDSRAEEDMKRLVAFLNKNQVDKRRIAILGFADNVGAGPTNIGLAQSRAETVALALQGLGVTPGLVRAYGEALPVGSNSDERGRTRNRRVEVWLCSPPACPLITVGSEADSGKRGIPAGVRLGAPRPPVEGEPVPKG